MYIRICLLACLTVNHKMNEAKGGTNPVKNIRILPSLFSLSSSSSSSILRILVLFCTRFCLLSFLFLDIKESAPLNLNSYSDTFENILHLSIIIISPWFSLVRQPIQYYESILPIVNHTNALDRARQFCILNITNTILRSETSLALFVCRSRQS